MAPYVLLLAMLFLITVSCMGPVPTDKYRVEETREALLVDVFADSVECRDQLEGACRAQLDNCSGTPGCDAFTRCVRNKATPAAEAECRYTLGVDLAAHWAYEDLRACWAKEFSACDVGDDFSCLNDYGPPAAAPPKELVISQKLEYLYKPLDGDDFSVRLCGLFEDCTEALAETHTVEGKYTASVPIVQGRVGQDWTGWRVVEGDNIPTSHIRLNLPVWGDRVETTRLASNSLLDLYRASFEASSTTVVFVQVLDCKSDPVAGVRLVPSSGRTRSIDGFTPIDGPTTGVGAGAVYDFDPATTISISAVRDVDDVEIASWSGRLPKDEAMYLKLYPHPRGS